MTVDRPEDRPPDPSPDPPPATRAADGDRDAAAAVVQVAHADGRLSVDELDERLTRVYDARTLPELRSVTEDLVSVPHGGEASTLELHAHGFGSVRREGRWRVPPHIVAATGNTDVRLDFATADVQVPDIHVEVAMKWGSVLLIVPEGWSIDLDGVTSKDGTVRNKAVDPEPGGVRLRVTGRTKHGTVVVRHPRPRRWWWFGTR